MKKQGLLKIGQFTKTQEKKMEENFKHLIIYADVDREILEAELFTRSSEKVLLLQRNLIGFYLLQNIAGADQRLPVDVMDKLSMIVSGKFTKEEDEKILAWVEEHGPKNWSVLADNLGRHYKGAAGAVQKHYKKEKPRPGQLNSQELEVILHYFLTQKPNALKKNRPPADTKWENVGAAVNRHGNRVYCAFVERIQPTILRFLAETLDRDVRPDLIRAVREEGWVYNVDIDFNLLAERPEFQGHTRASLSRLYLDMRGSTLTKHPDLTKCMEVTVGQVEEHWNNSKRNKKNKKLLAREQQIIDAYLKVKP